MAKRIRWTKWAFLLLTVTFLFLWGLSLLVYAFHLSGQWRVRMDYGVLQSSCYFGPDHLTQDLMLRSFVKAPSSRGWPTGWGYQSKFPNRLTWKDWYPRYYTWTVPNPPGVWLLYVHIPFWVFVMLTGVPAAYLFRRGRKYRLPGCCGGCGYDLFGNTTGKCPECGEKINQAGIE